ncbi:MAG: hypothetical protein JRE81_08365 [Deltaproteobacteria bacterium]|nr:hypothetical protein [Deltaproteobacteria bacterium]
MSRSTFIFYCTRMRFQCGFVFALALAASPWSASAQADEGRAAPAVEEPSALEPPKGAAVEAEPALKLELDSSGVVVTPTPPPAPEAPEPPKKKKLSRGAKAGIAVAVIAVVVIAAVPAMAGNLNFRF